MKQRLVGAAVLMALGVIFIPIFLAPEDSDISAPSAIQIARDTPNEEFSSKVQPIADDMVETLQDQFEAAGSLVDRGILPPEVETDNSTEADQNALLDSTVEKPPQKKKPVSPVEAPTTTPAKERAGITAWVVQAGSFSSKENAQKMAFQLKEKGYTAYIEEIVGDKTSYRVRIGPLLSKARAKQTAESLEKSLNVDGMILKYH